MIIFCRKSLFFLRQGRVQTIISHGISSPLNRTSLYEVAPVLSVDGATIFVGLYEIRNVVNEVIGDRVCLSLANASDSADALGNYRIILLRCREVQALKSRNVKPFLCERVGGEQILLTPCPHILHGLFSLRSAFFGSHFAAYHYGLLLDRKSVV